MDVCFEDGERERAGAEDDSHSDRRHTGRVVLNAEQARRWRLQVDALQAEDNFDEGTAEWRAAIEHDADVSRAKRGTPPLAPWWSEKTEHLLHERARALGLLG